MKQQRLRPLYYCLITISCLGHDGLSAGQEWSGTSSSWKVVSVVRQDQIEDPQSGTPTLVSTQAMPKYASLEQGLYNNEPSISSNGFCSPSQEHAIRNDTMVCKQLNDLGGNSNTTEYHESRRRLLNDETAEPITCGPNCRPSCLTLLLDLEKQRMPTCDSTTCQSCKVTKDAPPCTNEDCLMEDAKCLGPIVYEDPFSFLQNYTEFSDKLPSTCSYIPDEPRYNRFRGWPMAHSIEAEDCQHSCFADKSKLYFEFCNVVQEDPMCDACGDRDCETDCNRHVAPFPDGWTSFVVSASVPTEKSSSCDDDTGNACWMERIDVFFPPECPHCHECPLVSLGDRFGPLEVVGFGHRIGQPCAPCSGLAKLDESKLNCKELQQCQDLSDCATGESHGLPSFVGNQCSWRMSDVQEDGVDNTFTVEYTPRDNTAGSNEVDGFGDKEPSHGSPSLLKLLSNMPSLTIPIGLVVLGLMFLSLAMRRNRKRTSAMSNNEEIYYNKEQRIKEEKAIAIFLSDSDDNSSVQATTSQNLDDSNIVKEGRAAKRDKAKTSRFDPKAVQFRTASLIHQQGKNEVEVVETTGTHNIHVRWI